MLYLSICATLLTLLAAMYFLNYIKKENLASSFKWVTYIVIAVAFLILICQLTRGISKMACHKQDCQKECEMQGNPHHGMMMGGHGCMNMGHCEGMKGCEGMEGCKDMKGCEDMDDCKGKMDKEKCGHAEGGDEEKADSTAH